jgi:hypothetical protein
MAVGLKIDVNETLSAVIDQVDREMASTLERGMLLAAEHVVGEIRQEIFNKFNVRTGSFARSFKAQLLETGDGKVVAGALSDDPRARIQDEGGTIFAKAKKLAIPVGAGRSLPVGTGPRQVTGLELIPRPGKAPLLARVKQDGSLVPYFVLLSSVTLKGRDYLEPASQRSEPVVAEILDEVVQGNIDQAEADNGDT